MIDERKIPDGPSQPPEPLDESVRCPICDGRFEPSEVIVATIAGDGIRHNENPPLCPVCLSPTEPKEIKP